MKTDAAKENEKGQTSVCLRWSAKINGNRRLLFPQTCGYVPTIYEGRWHFLHTQRRHEWFFCKAHIYVAKMLAILIHYLHICSYLYVWQITEMSNIARTASWAECYWLVQSYLLTLTNIPVNSCKNNSHSWLLNAYIKWSYTYHFTSFTLQEQCHEKLKRCKCTGIFTVDEALKILPHDIKIDHRHRWLVK
jgi:hypothetical protein